MASGRLTLLRHRGCLAVVAAGILTCAGATRSLASVAFRSIDTPPLADQVKAAAEEGLIVMLVVTQPDWCPPCIDLDRRYLRNPDAVEIAALTKNWLVFEVRGYEPEGSALLARQQIEFVGTPTTFVIRLQPGDEILRDGDLLTAVVGSPEDYVAALRAGVEGNDDTAELEATAKRTRRPSDWMALGARYVERGQAARAARAFEKVIAINDAAAVGLPADSLAAMQKTAWWKLTNEVTTSIEKDYGRSLELLDRFVARYPEASSDEDYRYTRFFVFAKAMRTTEIMPEIEQAYFASGELDDLETFLYLAFRAGEPDLLDLAVEKAREGIERFPDAEAPLSAGLGRVYRALGQNSRAAAAFRRAMELTDPAAEAFPIYRAQFEHASSS